MRAGGPSATAPGLSFADRLRTRYGGKSRNGPRPPIAERGVEHGSGPAVSLGSGGLRLATGEIILMSISTLHLTYRHLVA